MHFLVFACRQQKSQHPSRRCHVEADWIFSDFLFDFIFSFENKISQSEARRYSCQCHPVWAKKLHWQHMVSEQDTYVHFSNQRNKRLSIWFATPTHQKLIGEDSSAMTLIPQSSIACSAMYTCIVIHWWWEIPSKILNAFITQIIWHWFVEFHYKKT